MFMIVRVNGQKKEISLNAASVGDLLVLEDVKNPDTVAVQHNGEFLNREAYETTSVKDGDDVEFVYFLGGGQTSAL
jgi:sulfur carrier protein